MGRRRRASSTSSPAILAPRRHPLLLPAQRTGCPRRRLSRAARVARVVASCEIRSMAGTPLVTAARNAATSSSWPLPRTALPLPAAPAVEGDGGEVVQDGAAVGGEDLQLLLGRGLGVAGEVADGADGTVGEAQGEQQVVLGTTRAPVVRGDADGRAPPPVVRRSGTASGRRSGRPRPRCGRPPPAGPGSSGRVGSQPATTRYIMVSGPLASPRWSLHGACRRREPAVETDLHHRQPAGRRQASGGGLEPHQLGGGQAERLLHEDVLAGLQGGRGEGPVLIVAGGDRPRPPFPDRPRTASAVSTARAKPKRRPTSAALRPPRVKMLVRRTPGSFRKGGSRKAWA